MPKTTAIWDSPCPPASTGASVGACLDADAVLQHCFHCGAACIDSRIARDDKAFCCQGCLTVYEILTENGLDGFYQQAEAAGVRGAGRPQAGQFDFVNVPAVRERLVDYSDERLTRVTFHVPAIHCIACVWLLENLYRLKPGIGQSRVNFPRKEVSISFETEAVRLSEIVALLATLGYEPELTLSDLGERPKRRESRRIWMQLGVAGFAFGNTMLFSVAAYLGLDTWSGPGFRNLTGAISLLLAIPVVVYSALDYWRSAWTSIRQRALSIDVPIAAGILALFGQSLFEVMTGQGPGYFDSLTGLLFFLLCGRLFQQKTFDRLSFERDFRSFFPLSVRRQREGIEERVALSDLQVGDTVLIRHGELIPADATLAEGVGLIDYSFVTGEAVCVEKRIGDHLYAGGRQMGGAIQVQTTKKVSQSYLASLWNQEAFQKPEHEDSLNTLTNRYSRRFTVAVLGIALGAAAFWAWMEPGRSLIAFTSVLIVACPCALALAAPFALGTAQRLLAGRGVFLKSPTVLERLAAADSMVFDKTGTLTSGTVRVKFHGEPLSEKEETWLRSLAEQSTHPHAVRVRDALRAAAESQVCGFAEHPGLGMVGRINGHGIRMGSAAWIDPRASEVNDGQSGSAVHVEIDGAYRGWFELAGSVRPETDQLLAGLATDYQLSLVSGDNARDLERFRALFGPNADLRFDQTPCEKLEFIQELRKSGRTVVMIGDGLNDAGALRESDVGVAVVENVGAFSPASDVIMAAEMVPAIGRVARFAKASVRVVRASFVISTLYNVVGISIAAQGLLSPVVCAILMPLSSVTVVAFACSATRWFERCFLERERSSGVRLLDSGVAVTREAIA